MKKIGLYLEAGPHFGGTFQYNQVVLAALAALPVADYEVVIGYTSEHWLPHLEQYNLQAVPVPLGFWARAAGLGWTLSGLPMAGWRWLAARIHPVARTLLAQDCDLWIFPSYDMRSYQYPLPALVMIHDLMFRYEKRFPESASGWEFLNRDTACRQICRWSAGVLVDSETGRRQMMESYGIAPERVHALPFIAPAYIHEERALPELEQKYSLPTKFIFYPAQFWAHKNHRNLIAAVARLKGELPDLRLVLTGGPKNAYQAVRRQVRELGLEREVLFAGYVSDPEMAALYRRARALVMPTYYGPTNIPPLEAFVAGCPVAISGIYGMPEQSGAAALYFDPDKVEEIADSIRRLWNDDRLCAELVARGKEKAAAWGREGFNRRLREIIELAIG